MQIVKAIIFDLDDTLLWDERSVQESFDAVCVEASKLYPIDPKLLESSVRQSAQKLYASYDTYSFTQQIGINPFEALWGRFVGDPGPDFQKLSELASDYRKAAWTNGLTELGVSDAALGEKLALRFMEERRNRPYVYDDTFEVLDSLRDNYSLMLLTNGSPSLQQEKLDMTPRLAPYFAHIIVSGSYGQGKPALALFEHALKRLGVEPSQAVMIGDKLTTDILGANQAGVHSVWLNRDRRSRTEEIVPKFEIQSLQQLKDVIEQLTS